MGHKASPEKVGGTEHACARCTGQDRKPRLCVALRRIGKGVSVVCAGFVASVQRKQALVVMGEAQCGACFCGVWLV